MAPMSGQKESDPVAQHIGSRIRDKRKQQGWSQKGLAERVGLAFQQIQKYESGANKVSSITLYNIAQTLGVPIGYFYEGLQGAEGDICSRVATLVDGPDMMKSFISIKNPQARATLVAMARTLAGSETPIDSNT